MWSDGVDTMTTREARGLEPGDGGQDLSRLDFACASASHLHAAISCRPCLRVVESLDSNEVNSEALALQWPCYSFDYRGRHLSESHERQR